MKAEKLEAIGKFIAENADKLAEGNYNGPDGLSNLATWIAAETDGDNFWTNDERNTAAVLLATPLAGAIITMINQAAAIERLTAQQ